MIFSRCAREEKMTRSPWLIALLAAMTLSACDPIGTGDLAGMSTDRLCQYYQSERAAARGRPIEVRAELERRGAVDPKDWPAIDIGDIHYGMNKCEIGAMGGPPLLNLTPIRLRARSRSLFTLPPTLRSLLAR